MSARLPLRRVEAKIPVLRKRLAKDPEFWLEVRRGALAMMAVSQRSSALWCLRSTPAGSQEDYTKGLNPEDRKRRREIFGVESITVTWNAFVALREIFGDLPDHPSIVDAVTAIYQRRTHRGGYGCASGRRTEHIFATSRHTATALLAIL
jgi:hypothetical protein